MTNPQLRVNRRTAGTLAASTLLLNNFMLRDVAAAKKNTHIKFTMDLCPGRIGVNANQEETIALAAKYGFNSVQPFGGYLASKSDGEQHKTMDLVKSKDLVWGAADLPVEFRKDEDRFNSDLENLPKIAATLQHAGVTRVGTYLLPRHNDRTYRTNFELHANRLRKVARVLADHNLRLGLEYVGPKTMRMSQRYTFIHTLAETMELIEAIGAKNVGLVLDSWHWYTAEETADDLKSLKNEQIVAVDLNDAPAGIEVDQQVDNRRELPAATGVIDVKTFLNTLVEIGYDGPIRAEPFNKPLNDMDNDPAVKATSTALQKAFAQITHEKS